MVETLKEINKRVKSLNINNGGCGLFAFKVANILNLDTFIYFHKRLSNTRKQEIILNQELVIPNHVMIEVSKNKLYDSTGLYTVNKLYKNKWFVNNMPVIVDIDEVISDDYDALYRISKDYLVELLNKKKLPSWNFNHSVQTTVELDDILLSVTGSYPELYYKD